MDRWYRRLGKLVALYIVSGHVLALVWPRYRQYWRAKVHLGRTWLDHYGSGGYASPMASDILARAAAQAYCFEPREKSAEEAFARRDRVLYGGMP